MITRGVVRDIQFRSQALDIAAMLDEQPHEGELLRGQTSYPIKAKSSLNHNSAARAFQARHDQFIAVYRVVRDQWIERFHMLPLSRREKQNRNFALKLL